MSWRALNSKIIVGGALGVQVKPVPLCLNSASVWRETLRLQGGELMHRPSHALKPISYPLGLLLLWFLNWTVFWVTYCLLAAREEASCGVLCLAGKLAAP